MRLVFALLIGLHGTAHLIGFAAKWELISTLSFPYRTSVFGVVELKGLAIRLVGLAWLCTALGCVFAGSALWEGASWGVPLSIASLVVSLALCVTAWPEARIGVLVNLFLLTLLLVRRSMVGWVL